MNRLSRSFFDRPTLTVAQELLGKRLCVRGKCGIITETEAYIGQDDPACHACRGLTPRNKPMFGPAGHTYIYFIYGMYFCLNLVTEKAGFPAAVLIRGVVTDAGERINGPGKLCRYFGLTKAENEIDVTTSSEIWLKNGVSSSHIEKTPRIGIKQGIEKLWRFVSKE